MDDKRKSMKPLRSQIEERRIRLNIPWNTLEQDFVLSWVLAGISQRKILRDSLIFKGGTALKKTYFGEYRFSEDLDFTLIKKLSEKEIHYEIEQACLYATEQVSEFVPDPIFQSHVYKEKLPHPHGQIAFTIRARLPWHKEPHVRVMVEITQDEPIMSQSKLLPIIYDYEGNFQYKIQTYSLEEIVCEKLRAILQHIKKLHETGWSRSRSRDYYDLWYIFLVKGEMLDFEEIREILPKKCNVKAVSWKSVDDFFSEAYLKKIRLEWDKWLGSLVPHLPKYGEVIKDLRVMLEKLLMP